MATKKLTEEERNALSGSVYDKQYFTDEELQNAAKISAAAKESGDWTSAHNYVEAIRNKYGYSGGTDGSGYTALQSAAKSTTSEAPTYVSQYADAINTLQNSILNRDAFSYDYATDPSYQSYKKQYVREGQRANADTLGQYASMTGGMPSTAAVNAASQAQDYYGAKLADVIPELYNAAYSRYTDEGNTMLNNLNTLLSLENADYAKYQDQLAQYNYENETAYNQNQDAKEEALNRIAAILETGTASGISSSDLALSGYTQDQLNTIAKYYANQNSTSSGSGSTDTSFATLLKNIPSADLDKLESFNGDENKVNDYLDSIFYTILGGNIDLKDYLFGRYTDADYSEPVKTTPISESEFNRAPAMVKKYGTYANYLRVFNQ